MASTSLTAHPCRNALIAVDVRERKGYECGVTGTCSERLTAIRNVVYDQPELKQCGNGRKWLGGAVLLGGAAFVLTEGSSTVPDLSLPPARP